MRLATPAQVREMDRVAIEERGIPGYTLMQAAGAAASREIVSFAGGMPERVVVLCGPGNNGGDGFLVARHLLRDGAHVDVFSVVEDDGYAGDAARALQELKSIGSAPSVLGSAGPGGLDDALSHRPLVVDALLGTGFHGELRERMASAIERVRSAAVRVVALDIPSGVEGATGRASPGALHADLTVTFAVGKVGLLREPGRTHAGAVRVVDIGIPRDVVDEVGTAAGVVTPAMAHDLLPVRPPAGHKGTFGHVLVVGGSPNMSGAIGLATGGALRGGAGLVTTATPASLRARIANVHLEAMSMALPETADSVCAEEGAALVETFVKDHDAVVALGPGLSRVGEAAEFARRVVRTASGPVVVDADALNAFEYRVRDLSDAPAARVLTPHPGEAARLLGMTPAEVTDDPLGAATQLADVSRAVVVLKGAPTVIADPGGACWMNSTGNVGMARGGSGDVLTGLIASILAAVGARADAPERAAVDAALLGVYLHGLAGDVAERRRTAWAMVAGDLTRYLPTAWALAARGRALKPQFEEIP